MAKKPPAPLEFAPIESARVRENESSGLALLGPGLDNEWTIGRWDGRGWFDRDGFALKPKWFAFLPRCAVVIAVIPKIATLLLPVILASQIRF